MISIVMKIVEISFVDDFRIGFECERKFLVLVMFLMLISGDTLS